MADSTVSTSHVRTPVNSLRSELDGIHPRPAKARIDANPVESAARVDAREEFVSLIRAAMKDAGLSQKAFSLNAGASESAVADGFNGVRNFAADWLWRQPDLFWLELRNRIEVAKGLNPEHARTVRAARISELVRLLLEVA